MRRTFAHAFGDHINKPSKFEFYGLKYVTPHSCVGCHEISVFEWIKYSLDDSEELEILVLAVEDLFLRSNKTANFETEVENDIEIIIEIIESTKYRLNTLKQEQIHSSKKTVITGLKFRNSTF